MFVSTNGWTTLFQSLTNTLYTGPLAPPGTMQLALTSLYFGEPASTPGPGFVPSINQWIAANNPYLSLTVGTVPNPDQWGVTSTWLTLATLGVIADYQNALLVGGSSYSSGKPNSGLQLQNLMTAAQTVLANGPPFTGARPPAVVVGWPWM